MAVATIYIIICLLCGRGGPFMLKMLLLFFIIPSMYTLNLLSFSFVFLGEYIIIIIIYITINTIIILIVINLSILRKKIIFVIIISII